MIGTMEHPYSSYTYQREDHGPMPAPQIEIDSTVRTPDEHVEITNDNGLQPGDHIESLYGFVIDCERNCY